MPFVQGQLRKEPLSFLIETVGEITKEPIQIEIDSDMNYQVMERGADPLVYVPLLDVHKLEAPSIIDAF